ncbi:MAG: hypothetical protein J5688_03530, partial [Paludibacteraceae bacterium]|nr:hypothetical protein [Paludibacteraceae bacterium]
MNRIRVYIVLFALLLAGSSVAAPRQYKSATVSHWVGLSLTGVEANVLPSSDDIIIKAGSGGGGHLLYELRTGGFFFNIGLGADYILTNTALASYTDA